MKFDLRGSVFRVEISLNRSEDNISVGNHNLSDGERLFYYVMNSWMSLTPPSVEYVLEECTYSTVSLCCSVNTQDTVHSMSLTVERFG